MTIHHKEYIIEIFNEPNYTLESADNTAFYNHEYFEGTLNEDQFMPTSKHGIRVSKDEQEIASAIVCAVGGATTIHENSFFVGDNNLLICCCDKVYSLSIPDLDIHWVKSFDFATCFGIYFFKGDFIIHGELTITRIDWEGNVKWEFGGSDIFVTHDGTNSMIVQDKKIILTDWEKRTYILNENGVEL